VVIQLGLSKTRHEEDQKTFLLLWGDFSFFFFGLNREAARGVEGRARLGLFTSSLAILTVQKVDTWKEEMFLHHPGHGTSSLHKAVSRNP
jgi:hypothetical protein